MKKTFRIALTGAFLLVSILPVALTLTTPTPAHAQELIEDKTEIIKGKVIDVISQRNEKIAGTETPNLIQKIRVELINGTGKNADNLDAGIKGKIIEIENDAAKVKDGDTVYIRRIVQWDGGPDLYSVYDISRLSPLFYLTLLFIILTIALGGKQGLRGLLSLAGSLFCIFFLLLPGIAGGMSPLWVSLGVSSLIIVVGSYVTHGFNKTTSCAVVGMIATIAVVGVLAHYSIDITRLTGFESDESSYLNFSFNGTLDLAGVLLGGMLIGLLGVMYDAGIGQAIAVEELHRVAPHLSRRTILARAMRIGREHIGALVNTLAIAYVGASLPLLLLFYTSSVESISVVLNREIFAAEIVRSLVGSIGLILTMPITTIIAVLILVRTKPHYGEHGEAKIQKELEALDNLGEHVGHSH